MNCRLLIIFCILTNFALAIILQILKGPSLTVIHHDLIAIFLLVMIK